MANKPKNTKELRIRVPTIYHDKYSRMVYRQMYMDDERDRIIYLELQANPTKPLTEIKATLLSFHKIRRTVEGLKKMAENTGLTYTE